MLSVWKSVAEHLTLHGALISKTIDNLKVVKLKDGLYSSPIQGKSRIWLTGQPYWTHLVLFCRFRHDWIGPGVETEFVFIAVPLLHIEKNNFKQTFDYCLIPSNKTKSIQKASKHYKLGTSNYYFNRPHIEQHHSNSLKDLTASIERNLTETASIQISN